VKNAKEYIAGEVAKIERSVQNPMNAAEKDWFSSGQRCFFYLVTLFVF